MGKINIKWTDKTTWQGRLVERGGSHLFRLQGKRPLTEAGEEENPNAIPLYGTPPLA